MSLSINNNITSLNAWRNLKSTDAKMSGAMEKLSSGLRINRAADDPAGLVISEKMRAQLAGLNAAINNSEKAINMVQTAEASLDKVQSLLDKMRQLALDSANSGVNDAASLKANQDEMDEAIASITRIANYTQFGTKKLLDGSLGTTLTAPTTANTFSSAISASSLSAISDTGKAGAATVVVGQAASKTTAVLTAASLDSLADGGTFTLNGVAVTAGATTVNGLMGIINGKTAETGVIAGTDGAGGILLTAVNFGSTSHIAFSSAAGQLGTAAIAPTETTGLDEKATVTFADSTTAIFDQGKGLNLADNLGNTISLSTNVASGATVYALGTVSINSASFQVGANESQSVSVSIQSTKAIDLGMNAQYTNAAGVKGNTTGYSNLNQLKSGSGAAAATQNGVFVQGTADQIAQAIGVIDKAIDQISTIRGKLGAMQSDNLQVQVDSLRVSYENLQASESTIRDTDMTSQMATFTKYQIMMQAGTAMLAQANQMPNNILTLLR